jgi:hypothetical protein
MKLLYGLVGYVMAAAALVGVAAFAISGAVKPTDASDTSSLQSQKLVAAEVAAKAEQIVATTPGERLPVWIAPTQKYAAPSFQTNNAALAKRIARGGSSADDWRLRERRPGALPANVTSYAATPAQQQPSHSRHHEPIQFRERTEPR